MLDLQPLGIEDVAEFVKDAFGLETISPRFVAYLVSKDAPTTTELRAHLLESLPEHIANAVFVLCTDQLSHTTGLHIPVDAGVAAAFLR